LKIKRNRIVNMLRCVTILTVVAMLLLSFPFSVSVQATSLKEEVVYVRLSNDGSVDKIYVINSFELGSDKQITDYGNYAYVQNLTNSDTLLLHDGVVTINTQADRLYYEGFLINAELPWVISINYWLDGKKITPEELGGKSGQLKIEVITDENPSGSREFFEKYSLQISITLDTGLCRNIEAESGTIASAGSNKQISFMALPGKKMHAELTSDVMNFEMPAITITGITMGMDMDFDDVDMSDIGELIDGHAKLDDGVYELLDGVFDMRDGVSDLHDGTTELGDGVSKFEEGVYELSDGTGELKEGVGDLKDGTGDMTAGAYELSDGMTDLLDGIRELDDGVGELKDGADEFYDGTGELLDGTEKLYGGIIEITDGAWKLASGASELSAGADKAAGGGKDLVSGYEAYFDAILAMVNAQLEPADIVVGRDNYEEVILDFLFGSAIIEAREAIRDSVSVHRDEILAGILAERGLTLEQYEGETIETREAIEQQLAMVMEQMVEEALESQLEQIKEEAIASEAGAELLGLLKLLSGYDALLSGLKSYTAGVNRLNDGMWELSNGISVFHSGLKEYSGGMKEYREGVEILHDGAGKLAEGVSDLKTGTLKLLDGVVELRGGVVEFRDGMVELHGGVIELLDGIVELHDGVVELHNGAIELRDGTIKLTDGTGQFLDGTNDLLDGVTELKDGIGELRENTAHLDTDIIDGINEWVEDLFGKDIPTRSFVSEKNGEINSVQFVMQTKGISLPETDKTEPALKPELNFWEHLWQRFIQLF
jgi:putative membrane protein